MNKLVATTVLSLAPAFGATYQLDSMHSKAQFAVKHMMISTVRGEFSKLQGTVSFDPANLASSKIDVSIDATSINTGEPKRDDHLRSPDFFDAAKYPTLTFTSSKISQDGESYKVEGTLTMHGVSKAVTLRVEPSAEIKDMSGAYRMGATATARVSRKDFGLTWNHVLEAGGVAVGDEVNITIDVEMTRK